MTHCFLNLMRKNRQFIPNSRKWVRFSFDIGRQRAIRHPEDSSHEEKDGQKRLIYLADFKSSNRVENIKKWIESGQFACF